jgi:hypothetical protein
MKIDKLADPGEKLRRKPPPKIRVFSGGGAVRWLTLWWIFGFFSNWGSAPHGRQCGP